MTTSDPFDPKYLSLSEDELKAFWDSRSKAPQRPPRHKSGQLFLKGPIPWEWLVVVLRLPRSAIAVGLLVWREAGFHRRRTVAFNLTRRARALGLHPESARRGLQALERVELVTVHRLPGCCLEVTLLDPPAPPEQRGEVAP
jgi:hypothetical protein